MKAFTNHEAATLIQENEIIYHQTTVAVRDCKERTIRLDSGGWRTATTKKRINQALRYWCINAKLRQSSGIWFVEDPAGATHRFYDGITITY